MPILGVDRECRNLFYQRGPWFLLHENPTSCLLFGLWWWRLTCLYHWLLCVPVAQDLTLYGYSYILKWSDLKEEIKSLGVGGNGEFIVGGEFKAHSGGVNFVKVQGEDQNLPWQRSVQPLCIKWITPKTWSILYLWWVDSYRPWLQCK